MGGIGVILNPRSRHNLREPRSAARLRRILGDAGTLRTARDKDELFRAAEDFRREGIDVLAISGGDGTNHVVLSGMRRIYGEAKLPRIALLRGGTMNTVAHAVGIRRGRPEGLLRRLVSDFRARGAAGLRAERRNTLLVGEDVGFLFGTGAIHGFIAEYNKAAVPGPVWAAEVLARGSASALVGGEFVRRIARRWEGRVHFDDGEAFADRDYIAVGAGTVDEIGLGFRPFYRAREREDAFHILGIHASAAALVARGLPRIFLGRSMGASHAYERLTRSAVLEARSGTVEYMCDGDIHAHRGPLRVAVGPRIEIVLGA